MLKILILIVAGFISSGVLAKGEKTVCRSKEVQARDCELRSRPYVFRLLVESISWNDSTWHKVDPIPLKGEGTSWEKVTLSMIKGRPVLQLWIWDKPVGETQVQSLNWYIVGIAKEKQELKVLDSGVVRKRRQKTQQASAEGAPTPTAAPASVKAPEYLYDGWETHGLKISKDGHIEMTLGRHKKNLEY